MRFFEPILPDTTVSVLRPIPILTGSLPSERRVLFQILRSLIMEIAARIALSSSSSCAAGIPKAAIMASPINLSSMPPSRVMQSTISSKYSLSRVTVPWAPRASVSVVNPRISEKSTVAGTLCPPNKSAPLESN